MEYRILGPVEVRVDGQILDLGPKKQRSLFALLLINHDRTVSTDRILDALWGDDAAGKENALWVYISRLRSILGEATTESVLVTRDHGYSVELGQGELDAAAFEEFAGRGLAVLDTDPREASELLTTALGLWRGNALEDFTYDDFAQPEITRLTERRRSTIDAKFEADLLCGRAGELIGELEQQAEGRPYDETPTRQLMLALYRSGRQTEALRTFERFRKRLGEDTGTEPSPELRRLEEQILFHDSQLARAVTDETTVDAPNPYRGLEAFREEDAHLFFGRDRLVAELLATIKAQPIVTVIGPSGCGKSSVVRSGVVPAIRKAALPGSDTWLVASMIPGSHPFVELEAALLRSTLDAPESLRGQFDGSPEEILRAALRVAPSEQTTVLVLVDQFEELFTVCDPATASRFLTGIVEAARDPRVRVRFILTLRADFYDRLLSHAAFGTAMSGGIVNVVPMAPEELEEAAAGPAQRVGVRLEPGLEAALIGDVLGEPGALPLFEFALTDLFDRRVGDTLTLDAYRAMGGIQGAVSRKAENLFALLSVDQQRASQQVFLRLVSISDGETRSRRRVEASELLGLDLDVADLQVVLEAFGRERLLSFDRSDVSGSPTVEVAHEALLEHWDRLAAWVTAAEDDVKQNARLTALAAEWEDHARDDAYLLSEGRYHDYAAWADAATLTLARPEREYLERSKQVYADRERDEADRVAREQATSRRAKRNAWGLVAVVMVVGMVAVFLIWNATRPEGPRVAYVHGGDATGISDMLLGGFIRAQQDLPIEAEEVLIRGDIPARLEELAASGPDLIIGGLDFAGYLGDLPSRYPDVHFAFVETAGVGEDAGNVTTLMFEDAQGSYLMGVAAAEATNTGKVAIVLPAQLGWFMQTGFADAFIAGVHDTSPDVEVVAGFISPRWLRHPTFDYWAEGWSSQNLAYDTARDLFENGYDVLYTAAGAAGAGTIAAAADHSEQTGQRVWAIGVDIDEGFFTEDRQKDYVLTSMIKNFDVAVYDIIERYLAEDLSEYVILGFDDGGVTYSKLNPAIERHSAILDETIAGLTSGSIVPLPSETPSAHWRNEPDVTIDATIADGVCELQLVEGLEAGDVLEVRTTNASAAPVLAAMGAIREVESDAPPEADAAGDEEDVEQVGLASWTIPPGITYSLRSELVEGFPGTGLLCSWYDPAADEGEWLYSEVLSVAP